MKLQIIFYSMYGHIHQLAEAVAEGARQVPGGLALGRRGGDRPHVPHQPGT